VYITFCVYVIKKLPHHNYVVYPLCSIRQQHYTGRHQHTHIHHRVYTCLDKIKYIFPIFHPVFTNHAEILWNIFLLEYYIIFHVFTDIIHNPLASVKPHDFSTLEAMVDNSQVKRKHVFISCVQT